MPGQARAAARDTLHLSEFSGSYSQFRAPREQEQTCEGLLSPECAVPAKATSVSAPTPMHIPVHTADAPIRAFNALQGTDKGPGREFA